MSFLFGKKKQTHNPLPPATRDTHTPGGSSISTTNGIKSKERGPSAAQTSTPGSSINNSITSVGGTHTPSPDHGIDKRGGPEQDRSVGSSKFQSGWQLWRRSDTSKLDMKKPANNKGRISVWPSTRSERSFPSRPQHCDTIPVVSAATDFHLVTAKSISTIWGGCECGCVERGRHISDGWAGE